MSNFDILFQAPVLSVQLLLDGILIGAVYALAAYGMALCWGVMNIVNICQGEYVILGGYVAFYVIHWGGHSALGVPAAAIVLYAVGWLIYRAVIWRVVDKDLFISILATYGIAILLQQLMNEVFGADIRSAESGLGTWSLLGGDVTVAQIKVVAFVTTGIIAVLIVWFLKSTRPGQAIRATAQNARAARIVGIDTDKVYANTYALNAAICGASGALVAMTWIIHPFIGIPYTIRSFMIVVVAGVIKRLGEENTGPCH